MKSKSAKNRPVYDPAQIEQKWQKKWAKTKIYRSKEKGDKFYVLDMFPYPSGEGLHVGHPKGYIATDVVSRMKRMQGHSVLHPMGFDAFGLPAEEYALKTKTHPSVAVEKNVKRYRQQLEVLGLDYDWSREINTTDPDYYRWTQWIFLQLFKKGLAFESFEPINWCPSCKTGLANEDLEDGRCERCGTPIEKKPLRQWVLRITDYAERLLSDLDATEYVVPKIIDKVNPHREGKPLVKRYVAHAIVFDPKTDKYLIIRNKKHGWDTVVIGGVEGDEDVVETARREIREETGYIDIEFKRVLGGPTEGHYYTKHKGENRIAIAKAVYFELKSDNRVPIADGEDADNEILWVSKEDFMPGKMVNSELPVWLERLADSNIGNEKPLLDWPSSIKELQRNWIGRSEGALIKFEIVNSKSEKSIEVFTTRADTLFGVTYVVLAPEHALVQGLLSSVSNKAEIEAYIEKTKRESVIDRTDAKKEKTGVELKGITVINPANKEEVPVWIADYVLADYGTGAVMAVPAHDERDADFAKKYNLPVKQIEPGNKKELAEKFGTLKVNYKLRDWVFSRQRYWGEPIPLIHCEKCGVVPVPEKDLPVELPKVESYEPTGTGESPLAAIEKWVNVKCPSCKGKAKRETNTMPQWAGSCWYYLRYMDPKNKKAAVDLKKEKYWAPVDLYVGGAEHATRHLIYARFWHKFLYDIGVVTTIEPFRKLQSVGLIMGEDGRKMGKRYGNVVNPDDVVATYGADSLRLYEMFMGPFDQQIAWSTSSMVGTRRFIERIWKLAEKVEIINLKKSEIINSKSEIDRIIHRTIKKVTEDIEALRFNTAISSLMILVNEVEGSLEGETKLSRTQFETILKLIAPFAPHVADELWAEQGNKKSIHTSSWPVCDVSLLVQAEVKIIVQINGKVRGSFVAPADSGQKDLEIRAQELPEVKKWLSTGALKKTIVVPGRLVNLVIG